VAGSWAGRLKGTASKRWQKERLDFVSSEFATVTGRAKKPNLSDLLLRVDYESENTILLTEIDKEEPLVFRVRFDESQETARVKKPSADYEWRLSKLKEKD
jgi:hypothetical protein